MSSSRLKVLLIILVAGIASAQVYRWVDEEGGVHFGDSPPENADSEEVVIPPGPSEEKTRAAQEQFRQDVEARHQTDTIGATVEGTALAEGKGGDEELDRRCVEVLYQLQVLDEAPRVFRLSPDGSRIYLEDADRPAEVARLESLRAESCSTEKAIESDQIQRAQELVAWLGPACAVMRDALRSMEDPESRTPSAELTEQRKRVESECPYVSSDGLWVRDWIYVGQDSPQSGPQPPVPPVVPPPQPPVKGHFLPKNPGAK